ncbi:hypothetical protein PFISCL1PPCAC_28874, partial [Pristionchus fissidentatus]
IEMRDPWHESEMTAMVEYVHSFVSGKFDSVLKKIDEREKTKEQHCGNKIWVYMEKLQSSSSLWNLGVINHSPASCQSKWSRQLQRRLHNVDNISSEKVLYLYFKLAIKQDKQETEIISRQYPGYKLTWRDGVLKDYQKKFNMNVEVRRADNESNERRKEKNKESVPSTSNNGGRKERDTSEEREVKSNGRQRRLKDDSPSGGAIVEFRYDLIPSRYRKGEDDIDRVTVFPRSSTQKKGRGRRVKEEIEEEEDDEMEGNERRTREESIGATIVKDEPIEEEEDVKPDLASLNSHSNVKNKADDNEEEKREREEPPRKKSKQPVIDQSTVSRAARTRRSTVASRPIDPSHSGDTVADDVETSGKKSKVSPAVFAPLEGSSTSREEREEVSTETIEEVWNAIGKTKKIVEKASEGKEKETREKELESSNGLNQLREEEEGTEMGSAIDHNCGGESPANRSPSVNEYYVDDDSPEKGTPTTRGRKDRVNSRLRKEKEDEETRTSPAFKAPLNRQSKGILRRPRDLLLNGRPTPAAIVGLLDRPVQQLQQMREIGMKRRSRDDEKALQKAAFNAQPLEKQREIRLREELKRRIRKKEEKERNDGTGVEGGDGLVEENVGRSGGRKDEERRGEGKDKKKDLTTVIKKVLNPTRQLEGMWENRVEAIGCVTDEETPIAVWLEVYENMGKSTKEVKMRAVQLAEALWETEEKPDETERAEIHRTICEDLVLNNIAEEIKDAILDDALWQ